jgi:hypothetical protein
VWRQICPGNLWDGSGRDNQFSLPIGDFASNQRRLSALPFLN